MKCLYESSVHNDNDYFYASHSITATFYAIISYRLVMFSKVSVLEITFEQLRYEIFKLIGVKHRDISIIKKENYAVEIAVDKPTFDVYTDKLKSAQKIYAISDDMRRKIYTNVYRATIFDVHSKVVIDHAFDTNFCLTLINEASILDEIIFVLRNLSDETL